MLVLSRKKMEQIQIGENITVTILKVRGQGVQIGIEAPRNVKVLRSELTPHESPMASEESESYALTYVG